MSKKLLLFVIALAIISDVLGQQPSTVQPFGEQLLIQFPNVRDLSMSSAEDEAYFTAQSPLGEVSVIMVIRKEGDVWKDPRIASFSGSHNDLEPFLSPDGLRLFFASDRPTDASVSKEKNYDIWYVERANKEAGWSAPKNAGPPLNTEHNEFYPAITHSNNLYFTSDKPGSKGNDDIYFSEWKNGKYIAPVNLSDAVNSEGYEFNAFVAPDESFMIFSGYNREDGYGSGDLYISYRNANGEWERAQNLGEHINSSQMDYCPFVNLNTRTLYFTSRRSEVQFRDFTDAGHFLSEITKYANGLSRLYQVSFEPQVDTHK